MDTGFQSFERKYPQWICCQLGAREHYAIPRALQAAGQLRALITDAWVSPGQLVGQFSRSLNERFHHDLIDARVIGANLSSIRFELISRLQRKKGWNAILARNNWFQASTVRTLNRIDSQTALPHISSRSSAPMVSSFPVLANDPSLERMHSDQPTLFSYSYTALEPFRWAKSRGWATVLGQIDPGIGEEKLLISLAEKAGIPRERIDRAPCDYWKKWRAECSMADRIIVNSNWSRALLIEEGIPREKLRLLPLAYTPSSDATAFVRQYPSRFSIDRPLRILFLGQINLRKGARELIDAVRLLSHEPVEFWMVGPLFIDIPQEMREHQRIRWIGPVTRNDVSKWYCNADVFMFPTHCDGFGMTQLEAQSWKLPVIASPFCGDVVRPNINGLRLKDVCPETIADAIRLCLAEPQRLAGWARNATSMAIFSIECLQQGLLNLDLQI